MAQSTLTYDTASDLLMKWYHLMRVDYLIKEELEYELTARCVIITRDMNLACKRKFLRDRLKLEAEGKSDSFISVPADTTNDLTESSKQCTDLVSQLQSEQDEEKQRVLQHRLVHYGAKLVRLLAGSRGSPNLHSGMQSLLVEVVKILEPFLGKPSQEDVPNWDDDPNPDEDDDGEESEDENDETNKRKKKSERQSVLDWIHSLHERIYDLEQELAKRKEGRDSAVQTSSSFPGTQNPFDSYSPSHNFPPFNPPQNFPNPRHEQIPNPWAPNSFPPFVPCSLNPASAPAPPLAPEPAPRPLPNPFPPVQYPTNAYQSRHTLPVSKWNITKYSGDDQGLRLNEFLELIQALSLAEHVSDRELFESAVHLFTGSALKWYMTQRSTGRLMNWEHLVFELRRTYMHPDLDALIKMKIYQRRQQKQESFHEYYFEMEKLFRTMCVQIPDHEKVQILQQNMRVDYKRQMTFIPIVNLETLVAAGQKLDALNFSAYNKIFGTEKTVQVIENQDTFGRDRQKPAQQPTQQQKRFSGPFKEQQGNQNRTQQNSPSQSRNQPPTSGPSTTRIQQKPPPNQNLDRNSRPKSPVPGPSGTSSRPPITLEQVVNGHKPPHHNTCFNCGTPGHHLAMCRQARRLFCENCGLQGFPTNFCPYCIKNGPRANENRRPQNPQA